MQNKLTVLFAFAIFVLVVGWAITPAQAHIKFCGTEPLHKHCTGGDDGEPPMIVATVAQWDGGDINGDSARLCVASQVQQNGDSGFYDCEVGPSVTYALGIYKDQTLRNGDASPCDVFRDGITLTPDYAYGYSWSDNCGDDLCTFHIRNWFSNDYKDQVTNLTGGSFIRLRGTGVATGPFTNTNPFVDSLTLNVDEITVTFFAAGSNKRLAKCQYLFEEDEVTFQTDQAP